MNALVDTLAFAERFENAGFGHEQAHGQFRDGLATKTDLVLSLAELEGRLGKQFGDLEVRLTRHVGEVGKHVTGRLWSAVTIIGGVSTAVAAVISAGVALLLRSGVLS